MSVGALAQISEEEKLVAELELLGIHYLSRQSLYRAESVRPPEKLLSALVQQPSARVRASVIAVLLTHPEYAQVVSIALQSLSPARQITLRLYYIAAFLLQRIFAERLKPRLGERWQWLPELFSESFDLTNGTPRENLIRLGREYQRLTQTVVNWAGSCEDVARRLLRQWDLESQWKE